MSELSDKQIQEAKKVFAQFDSDNSGKISVDELKNMLPKLGIQLDNKGLQKMVQDADKDKNGEVDFDEFIQIAKGMFITGDIEAENRKTFDEFDTNKDGFINKEEFKKALKEDPSFEDDEIEDIFQNADKDNDGKISFEEFCEALGKQD